MRKSIRVGANIWSPKIKHLSKINRDANLLQPASVPASNASQSPDGGNVASSGQESSAAHSLASTSARQRAQLPKQRGHVTHS